MMSQFVLPIILQVAGALVVMAEIIIPSAGILSIIAAGLIGYSIYLVFTDVSHAAGMMFVMADIIALPVVLVMGFKLLAKSPATLKTSLLKSEGFTSQPKELETYNGKTGKAVTDLRPAGTAIIDDQRVDVVSRGEYIEKGASILVLFVDGNRVVVKKV